MRSNGHVYKLCKRDKHTAISFVRYLIGTALAYCLIRCIIIEVAALAVSLDNNELVEYRRTDLYNIFLHQVSVARMWNVHTYTVVFIADTTF